jgi:hypothetical protein
MLQAGPDEENYIGRITEFFKGLDQVSYFTCQWFFRAADTVGFKLFAHFLKERHHVCECE